MTRCFLCWPRRVTSATGMHATLEELLELVFCLRSSPRLHKEWITFSNEEVPVTEDKYHKGIYCQGKCFHGQDWSKIMEKMLGAVISSRSVPSGYITMTPVERVTSNSRAEAGSNTSTNSPASCRRRQKGKSRIWDSKIWSRVPRDSDARMTALARPSSNC
jgi:hypothetical protein